MLNEIRGWLSLRSIDLKLLARVEDSVLDHYKGFTTFRDLGQGTFLQLLSEDKEIETMITVSSNAQESVIGIRMSDAIDLIQQCDVNSAKVIALSFFEFRSQSRISSNFLVLLPCLRMII